MRVVQRGGLDQNYKEVMSTLGLVGQVQVQPGKAGVRSVWEGSEGKGELT